jgi:hypothetical protein
MSSQLQRRFEECVGYHERTKHGVLILDRPTRVSFGERFAGRMETVAW